MSSSRKPASEITASRNREAAAALPPESAEDLADAERGLVARFEPARVEGESGRVVWDLDSYGFLDGDCPETAHPSLWRQSRLNRNAGLFEIAPGFWILPSFAIGTRSSPLQNTYPVLGYFCTRSPWTVCWFGSSMILSHFMTSSRTRATRLLALSFMKA